MAKDGPENALTMGKVDVVSSVQVLDKPGLTGIPPSHRKGILQEGEIPAIRSDSYD